MSQMIRVSGNVGRSQYFSISNVEISSLNEGFQMDDRVVVITGGGQGIGRVFAHAFAKAGATSVIAELNADAGEAVAKEIRSAGGQAFSVVTDIGEEESTLALSAAVLKRCGRIDVLINNAGIFSTIKMRPFTEISLEEWNQVLHVNITGVFLATRAVVPAMKAQNFGRVINISSAAVSMGRPGYLHYIASKSALLGMSRSMAHELGAEGITVNSILPGATETEIERATVTPEQKQAMLAMRCVARAETPEDLVGTALFLASPSSAFLTGQSLTVDGGLTHL
jgi:NAD(P)-dependent dehydrogenase (short-subunit alcohol dehydrogenase family)